MILLRCLGWILHRVESFSLSVDGVVSSESGGEVVRIVGQEFRDFGGLSEMFALLWVRLPPPPLNEDWGETCV